MIDPDSTYLTCCVKDIHDAAVYRAKQKLGAGESVKHTPLQPNRVYLEEYSRYTALKIMGLEACRSYPNGAPGPESCHELVDIARADLNQIRFEYALPCWLSYSSWRLREIYPQEPENNLHYGLVLHYPEPVIRASLYWLNLGNTEVERKTHDQAFKQDSHDYALRSTCQILRMSAEDVNKVAEGLYP